MSNWIHKTTKRVLNSVATADLPEAVGNYIEDPDLSSVTGQPSIYWKITGNVISLMSQAEQDAVDAAALIVNRDNKITEIDDLEGSLRQIVRIIMDELNTLRGFHGLPVRTLSQLRTAIRNGYGN